MPARSRLTLSAALALALTVASALPGAAAPTTTLAISSTAASASSIAVSGSLQLGDDATGALTLGEDPSGDSTVPQVGLDIKKVSVVADVSTSRLIYRIETHDMPPVVDGSAPFYGYTIPIAVDGDTTPGYFLGAGNAGSNFPPAAGKWWALCTSTSAGYGCTASPAGPLSGTMSANLITITLPFARVGATRGATIEPGTVVGCPGACSTLWAGLLFNNTGGDSLPLPAFKIPGSVSVGVARADTPIDLVATNTPAAVAADGSWTASLGRPSTTGDHIVVARSCWGNTEAPTCVIQSAPITL